MVKPLKVVQIKSLSLDVSEKNESLRRVHYIMHSAKNESVIKPAVPSTPSSLHLIPSRVAAKQLTLDPGSSSSPFESPVVSSLFLTSSTLRADIAGGVSSRTMPETGNHHCNVLVIY